jgi:hypothetical protein
MAIQRIGNSSIFGISSYINVTGLVNPPINSTADIYTVVGRGKLKYIDYTTQRGYSADLEIIVDGVPFATQNPGYVYLDTQQTIYKVFPAEVNFRTSLVIRLRTQHSVQTNTMFVKGVVELI